MLTKDDFIAIGQVIDQRLDKRLEPFTKDVRSMKSDLRKVQKDVRVILAVLDRQVLNYTKELNVLSNI